MAKKNRPLLGEPSSPENQKLLDAAASNVADIAHHPDVVREAMSHDIAKQEQSALRRISPLRDRWPEVDEFDDRTAEFDQRRQRVAEELQRLRAERNLAPEHDARTLAEWLAGGEKGKRPEPTAPALDRQIEELERERDALVRAADDVLAEKAAFVERHRKRLVRDADSDANGLREAYEARIAELAKVRDKLAATRAKAVWAATFPSQAAGASPPMSLAGGRHPALERAGLERRHLNPSQVWDVLKADAEFLATALSTEQAEAMGLKRPGQATWGGTPEAIEAERAEQKKARQRYKETWGNEPPEFGLIS